MSFHNIVLDLPNDVAALAPLINPARQTQVDITIANLAAETFKAQIAPAEKVGDELFIRFHTNPFAPEGQKLWLSGLHIDDNIGTRIAFNGAVGQVLEFPDMRLDIEKQPAVAILRSTGKGWLVVAATKGVVVVP